MGESVSMAPVTMRTDDVVASQPTSQLGAAGKTARGDLDYHIDHHLSSGASP